MVELLSSCPELTWLVNAERVSGRSGREVVNPGGRSTHNNLLTLQSLMRSVKPKRSMEVGLAWGTSALLFSAIYRESGAAPSKQHVAIDPFQTSGFDDVGLMTLDRAGLGGYVEHLPTMSNLALPELLRAGAKFDLIYVDGSHLFEDVVIDFHYCTHLLADNGVVAFDDSVTPDVQKVHRFIRRNLSSTLQPLDLSGHRAERGIARVKYRTAKMLNRVQLVAYRKVGELQRPWDAKLRNF